MHEVEAVVTYLVPYLVSSKAISVYILLGVLVLLGPWFLGWTQFENRADSLAHTVGYFLIILPVAGWALASVVTILLVVLALLIEAAKLFTHAWGALALPVVTLFVGALWLTWLKTRARRATLTVP